jgi:hypothetical protein
MHGKGHPPIPHKSYAQCQSSVVQTDMWQRVFHNFEMRRVCAKSEATNKTDFTAFSEGHSGQILFRKWFSALQTSLKMRRGVAAFSPHAASAV